MTHFPYDVIELGRCKMKKSIFLPVIVLVLAIVLAPADKAEQKSQSADVLLGAALHQEEVEGNLEAAIEIYKKILADYANNRPVAARALLQMGHCYEKLGKSGARMAYERLLRDYADQNEAAAQARTRLAALRKLPGVTKEPALATRKVWTLPDIGNVEGAPSPDGRYISFTDWETGDLAIRDLEAGTNRRLTDKGPWEKSEEFALFSRWSPDGRQIAYDWYDGKCMNLRVIALEGGNPRTLFDNKNDGWVQTHDWSPDSKQILILLEKKDGEHQILLVSLADGTTKVIKTFERPGRFPQTMRFSGDGRYIAYDQPQEENAAERDIFLISIDGGQEVALVEHPAHDLLLGWPPDGKGILFASDRTGSLDIWFLPVSGGKAQGSPELVRRGTEQIVPLGFTQNGSFYYTQGGSMLDAYVARMDRQSGKILAPPEKAIKRFEGANSWPMYSPDGKYMAYLSTRSHRFQAAWYPNVLCIRSLENTVEREFPTKFRRLAGLRWAPDGKSIYLAAWDDQGMGIYQADTQTGTMIPIVRDEGPQRIHSHNVSPDGKTLIYVRRYKVEPKEPYRILSRDLTTGEEKELYSGNAENGWLYATLSPDGERLAVINMDKKKTLRLIPTRGGEPRDLLRYEESRGSFTPLEWTADGKHILFSREQSAKDGPRLSLWRVSADGGEPQELGLGMINFENLSVHPDGVQLAFSSLDSTMKWPSVWVMENFLPPAQAGPTPVTMTARRLDDQPGLSGEISPDGRHLSFWDWRTGDIAVRDLQTGQDRRLTDEGTEGKEGVKVSQWAGWGSAWSSDSKQIAYAWFIAESDARRVELRVVGLNGAKPRVLARCEGAKEIGSFAWSPDGKHIAASVYPQSGSPRMELFSTADGSTRTLIDLKREISTTKRFSPDSRYIAYDRLPDEMSPERDIFLMNIDTGQETPLIKHPADDYLLGWSRDGKWLVFASDRTGALGLWVVGMSGAETQGEPRLVKPGIDRILPVGLTRQGALYYGVVRATEDVYVADLDPTTRKVIGPPRRAIEQFEGGNFSPSYSPDGKYLAYVSRRGNSPYPTNHGNALCIRSLDTGQERVFYREIWRLGLGSIVGVDWSSDNRFVTFGGSEGLSEGLYRIDLETSEITRIVRFGTDEMILGGVPSFDGRYSFDALGNQENGFSQIVARNLETGELRELYRFPRLERGITLALSPDGRWLSFINAGWGAVRSLRIMPASGGDAREVWSFGETKEGTPGGNHTWTPDGRYIVFEAPDPSDMRVWDLWRVPVEGGQPEKIGLQRRWGILSLTIRPDGRQLAFAGRGGSSMDSELWVLENFLPQAGSSK
jgi:Tol biopolymer transport system component